MRGRRASPRGGGSRRRRRASGVGCRTPAAAAAVTAVARLTGQTAVRDAWRRGGGPPPWDRRGPRGGAVPAQAARRRLLKPARVGGAGGGDERSDGDKTGRPPDGRSEAANTAVAPAPYVSHGCRLGTVGRTAADAPPTH